MAEPTGAEVSPALLSFLRRKIGKARLSYAEPPVRVEGGFDTLIYGFRLERAPEEYSKPLILRVFREGDGPERVRWERAVQNAVSEQGFPAPRVLLSEAGQEPLGNSFLVMERLPGRPMLELFFRPSVLAFRLPGILAATQARLHALDPGPVVKSLETEGFAARRVGEEAWIDGLQGRIELNALDRLRPGLRWVLEHRPSEPQQPVICHGDFHPINILMVGHTVTGVVDWPMVTIADPAYDVGATIALFTQGPVGLPGFLQGIADRFRRRLVQRYYQAYDGQRRLDPQAVSYYEALRCLGFLVEASEHRLADTGIIERPKKPTAFTAPRTLRSILSRFGKITGVTLTLPAG